MSAPRAKRPFAGAASDPAQRQITSFFSSSLLSTTNPNTATTAALDSRPVLPADTQSSLLNVGMRVRKSVPEGYKTGSPYSGFSLFDENLDKLPAKITTTTTTRAFVAPGQRELTPFCGLNKIGGLAVQPFAFSAVPGPDDVPSLSSSQDSIASNMTTPTSDGAPLSINTNLTPNTHAHAHAAGGATRKRIYSDSDDSDTPSVSECLQVPNGDWMDGQVSPRSLVPVGWENTRVMAVPRRTRRRTPTHGHGHTPSSTLGAAMVPTVMVTGVDAHKALGQLGQENTMVDDDFPEAEFLDYELLDGDAMEI